MYIMMFGLSFLCMVPIIVTGIQPSLQDLERNVIPRGDYEDILERLQSLEDQFKNLAEVVKQQNKKIETQENTIGAQDETISRQNQKLLQQGKKIDSLQKLYLIRHVNPNAIPNLWTPQPNLNGDEVGCQNQTDTPTAPIQLNKSGKGINEVHPSPSFPIKRAIASTNSTVTAFHALLHQDMLNLPPGQIIRFGDVKVNMGNRYTPEDGIFECRVPGYYMFHLYLMAPTGHIAFLTLTVNGAEYAHTYADSTNHYNSDSNVAFVHLNSGDRVWIEVGYAVSSIHIHHTSFFGVLLFNE